MARAMIPVSSTGQGEEIKIISHSLLTLSQRSFITLTLPTLSERQFSRFEGEAPSWPIPPKIEVHVPATRIFQ
jgi:hypothetical protein